MFSVRKKIEQFLKLVNFLPPCSVYYYMSCTQYGSLEDVMRDVELLVSNATTFNEEDSTVYQVEKIFIFFTNLYLLLFPLL